MIKDEASHRTADHWHSARSKLIDAFAALENALVAILNLAGITPHGDTLGQKIEKLRKAKPGSRYSKARKAKVEALLPNIEELLDVRNTIVHASLRLAQIDSKTEAAFINPKSDVPGRRKALLIDFEEFAKIGRETTALAQALIAPVPPNPASSPPRPSPGAAGDP